MPSRPAKPRRHAHSYGSVSAGCFSPLLLAPPSPDTHPAPPRGQPSQCCAGSTGPRTPQGKARVARNPIKHGFFVAQERWTPEQHRDFEATLAGLREDFRPAQPREEYCVRTMAESYIRMASALRYENLAAVRHQHERDRALDERIAGAEPAEAARLKRNVRIFGAAGLLGPTIPGAREAAAINRYLGRLHRTIDAAVTTLKSLKASAYPARPSRNCKNKPTIRHRRIVVLRPGEGPQTPRHQHRNRKNKPAREASSNGILSASRRTSRRDGTRHRNRKNKPTFFNVYGQSCRATPR